MSVGTNSPNIWFIAVTAETSQDPIGFNISLAPSIGDISSVSTMASMSCSLDFITHTAVVHHFCSQMGGLGLRVRARANVRA